MTAAAMPLSTDDVGLVTSKATSDTQTTLLLPSSSSSNNTSNSTTTVAAAPDEKSNVSINQNNSNKKDADYLFLSQLPPDELLTTLFAKRFPPPECNITNEPQPLPPRLDNLLLTNVMFALSVVQRHLNTDIRLYDSYQKQFQEDTFAVNKSMFCAFDVKVFRHALGHVKRHFAFMNMNQRLTLFYLLANDRTFAKSPVVPHLSTLYMCLSSMLVVDHTSSRFLQLAHSVLQVGTVLQKMHADQNLMDRTFCFEVARFLYVVIVGVKAKKSLTMICAEQKW